MKSAITLLAACLTSAAQAAPTCWTIEPASSRIDFTGMQSGTPVTGNFRDVSGSFLDDGPSKGLEVSVRPASIDTGLPELDGLLRGPLFFSTSEWPEARFSSESIEQRDETHYRARGELTVRGITRDVAVNFQFRRREETARLEGEHELHRLDYRIGTGDWSDTEQVANTVTVRASLGMKSAGMEACRPQNRSVASSP